jgi:hypothetical protein
LPVREEVVAVQVVLSQESWVVAVDGEGAVVVHGSLGLGGVLLLAIASAAFNGGGVHRTSDVGVGAGNGVA